MRGILARTYDDLSVTWAIKISFTRILWDEVTPDRGGIDALAWQKANGGRRESGGAAAAVVGAGERGKGGGEEEEEGAYTTRIALTSQSVLRSSRNHSGGTSKPKPTARPRPPSCTPPLVRLVKQ